MKTIKTYLDAIEKVIQDCTEQQKFKKESQRAVNNIKAEYSDRIRKIEFEKYRTLQIMEDTQEETLEKMSTSIEPSKELQKEFKKIMNFFLLIQDFPAFKKPVITIYKHREKILYKPIDIIADDKFKFIATYIIDNHNKPINKYSLIIAGNSIFNNQVMPLKVDYIHDTSENTCLIIQIKDSSSKEALIEWYKKNFKNKCTPKILKDFLTAQKEYQEAKDLYNESEWSFAFLKYQKNYYEHEYSRGTETIEYKKVVRQLNNRKTININ